MGDGVELALKPLEDLETLETFKSYTQIFSPKIEKEHYGQMNLLDRIYDMFLYASGQRFLPALSMAKFSKISKVFKNIGNKPLTKFDVDVCYKKMVTFHEQMDFYAFVDSIEFLLQKCFVKTELDEEKKLRILIENFDKVKSLKKTKSKKKGKKPDGRTLAVKGVYIGSSDNERVGRRNRKR